MAHVFWTADLDTGFQDIDQQHKQLLQHINDLHGAHETAQPELMNIALFDLISFVMSHFAHEEEMLAQAGYHLLAPRKRMHQNFVDKLVEYQMKMMENPNVIEELLGVLDGWLLQHIRINDKGYVQAVINSGIYRQDEQGNYVRQAVSDSPAQFDPAEWEMWENLNPNDDDVHPPAETPATPTRAWDKLVAQREHHPTQKDDDDDNKPRGWASTF